MKNLFVFCILLVGVLSVRAAVNVTVCDPVHLRPLWHHEVMLGSQVSLLVHSDANDLWSGGLFIHNEHRPAGMLSWRSDDPNAPAGQASGLEAAGRRAFLLHWRDSWMSGFDLYTDELSRTPGDWFVLDYTPLDEGECLIHYYNHSSSFTVPDPNKTVVLANTASRDLNDDGVVNYADFAIFSSYWLTECADPNTCGGADLDRDGVVGLSDVLMFADFWLWGTPTWPPEVTPEPTPEPTLFYSITDPNGRDEISIPVGQSVRLYLDKTTIENDVTIFWLEVLISDPNLGWIDNTPYDPNDPPGDGTAELLAWPHSTFFDYWGPGEIQQEGIQFLAASFSGPIEDGPIASFVYTPMMPGTVTLSLYTHLDEERVVLGPMVLHQYEPEGQMQMMSAGDPIVVEDDTTTEKTTEEMVEALETIWDESPELQETVDEDEWTEFVEAVKQSAEMESVE